MADSRQRQEWLADVREVTERPAGRRFVFAILGYLGLRESAFRTPSKAVRDEERLVFNCAWRDAAQWLEGEIIGASYENYQKMQHEAFEATADSGREVKAKKEAKADDDAE